LKALTERADVSAFQTMLVVSTVAGAVTGLGGFPVLIRTRANHQTHDALGLAAGITRTVTSERNTISVWLCT
jgi:hypothetical protein